MKRYLLFAGDAYYPQPAWHDFAGSFDSIEDALVATASEHFRADWWHVVDSEVAAIVKHQNM